MARIYIESINIYLDDESGGMYDAFSGNEVTQTEYEQRMSTFIKEQNGKDKKVDKNLSKKGS